MKLDSYCLELLENLWNTNSFMIISLFSNFNFNPYVLIHQLYLFVVLVIQILIFLFEPILHLHKEWCNKLFIITNYLSLSKSSGIFWRNKKRLWYSYDKKSEVDSLYYWTGCKSFIIHLEINKLKIIFVQFPRTYRIIVRFNIRNNSFER